MSRSAGGRVFLFSRDRLGWGLQETVSSKAVPDVLNKDRNSNMALLLEKQSLGGVR